MILIAGSAELRLDVIRDLKAAGYVASAPNEAEDEAGTGYSVHVEDPGTGERDRVLTIARGADPSVRPQSAV
jgi:hypothetical protein